MSASSRNRIDKVLDSLSEINRLDQARDKPILEPTDIVDFCKDRLGFTPTGYQEKLLRDPSQFIVARWARQSGKSQTLAALVLYHALSKPKTKIVVLAPGLRQSRKIIERAESFLPKLPREIVEGKVLRTKLGFVNGSTIEALPNNPATVRGNTLDFLILDEMGWIQDDMELYDAAVYALATTGGKFIGASTPGSIDTLFYLMCTDDEQYGDVSRNHVTWNDALEPNGPLKKETLEKLRRQMVNDPWRWTREMEAEFAVSDDAWISLELARGCVDPTLEYLPESAILGARQGGET